MTRTSRPSIDELCAKYDNENPHTEHVTALALRLFDRARGWLLVPASGRRWLEAAGRLHDVAYSIDPVRHYIVSTEIVRKEGLRGYRKPEIDKITQIMVRHSGKLVMSSAPKHILQLAAFLRVGDGLEYSHAQTSHIVSVRRANRTIHVIVECDEFPQCLARANRKADLWRAIFPCDIQFHQATIRKGKRHPMIRPDTPVLEAARRLMWIQFKTILANVDDAVAGKTSEPVHRIRVAVRRLSSLLHTFGKYLPKKERKEIDDVLDNITDELGPVRDLDVWTNFLQSSEVREVVARSRVWPAFLQYHLQRRKLVYATVRRALRGSHFASQRLKINRLLRVELPRLIQSEPPGSLPEFAATQLRKGLRRAMKKSGLRHSHSAKKLHELRIALRKARYLGEFFGPVTDGQTAKVLKHLRQVEKVLSRIHDIDMALRHLTHEGPTPPRSLAAYLTGRRTENLARLGKTWKRLRDVQRA